VIPALVISIPVEGGSFLFLDARHEGERERLLDWLGHSFVLPEAADELLELFADLLGLERDEDVP
jgi:hypothetical protein